MAIYFKIVSFGHLQDVDLKSIVNARSLSMYRSINSNNYDINLQQVARNQTIKLQIDNILDNLIKNDLDNLDSLVIQSNTNTSKKQTFDHNPIVAYTNFS